MGQIFEGEPDFVEEFDVNSAKELRRVLVESAKASRRRAIALSTANAAIAKVQIGTKTIPIVIYPTDSGAEVESAIDRALRYATYSPKG